MKTFMSFLGYGLILYALILLFLNYVQIMAGSIGLMVFPMILILLGFLALMFKESLYGK